MRDKILYTRWRGPDSQNLDTEWVTLRAADLDKIAKIVKEAAEHIESICPRPGPYHPAFFTLINLADQIKIEPRGP